jgi:hypothetical protein
MKGSVPHHAENHSFSPGPGKGNKFLTFLSFSESEGGQGKIEGELFFTLF